MALELVEEEVVDPKTGEKKLLAAEAGKAFDAAEADHRNRDIEVVSDESENEEEKMLREYRERMAALLPEAGANFAAVADGQAELDAGFDAFMDEEYDEDKLGGLYDEDIVPKDTVEKKVLDEAVDEFIVGTKQRFLDLAKEFGGEDARNVLPDQQRSDLIYETDLKDGEDAE